VSQLRKCNYCKKSKPPKDFDQNKKGGSQCNACKNKRRQEKISSNPFNYIHNLYVQLKYTRIKQGVKWKITTEDLNTLYAKQKGLCALTNVELTHKRGADEESDFNISIDRIDPAGDYVIENIQLIAKIVNFLKRDIPEEKFIKIIKLLYNNLKE